MAKRRFYLRTQLIGALIEPYPDSRFGQFVLAPEPLWDWDCSALDPQDAIKELMNCVLQPLGVFQRVIVSLDILRADIWICRRTGGVC